MPFRDHVELMLTEEQIWRGQGGRRPEQVRPALRNLMNRALQEGVPLLHPRVAYERFRVEEIRHGQVVLEDGIVLHSPALTRDVAAASGIVLAACTIGPELDQRVHELLSTDLALAATLDGIGSAAIDALSSEVCRWVETEAQAEGLTTSMPFSPGEGDWPLSDQRAILEALSAHELGIVLSPDYVMTPQKSLTMVIGVGKGLATEGVPCDRCSAAPRCRYRVHKES